MESWKESSFITPVFNVMMVPQLDITFEEIIKVNGGYYSLKVLFSTKNEIIESLKILKIQLRKLICFENGLKGLSDFGHLIKGSILQVVGSAMMNKVVQNEVYEKII